MALAVQPTVRALFIVALALGFALPVSAQDSWSDPFPGVRHLHRVTGSQNLHALVVDLCAAGVSLRGTATGERGRTVGSFGALVGAQAAINGDFFGSGYSTDGPSAHGGAVWGGGDHGYVAPLAFGDHAVELRRHEDTSGVAPWMREIVSGHPTILDAGAFRASDDPLCTARHPRTAVGLSADRHRLILAVIDGRASGRIGMTCAEEAALLSELGATDGLNLDGGGSSTMWIGGSVVNRPSDGSSRTVGSHLALFATGSGPAAHCPDHRPEGWIDAAACDGIRGWATDADTTGPIDVHLYLDGSAGAAGAVGFPIHADVHRDDVGAHGFLMPVPYGFMDGRDHPVFAYGIGAAGGANALLSGSPATLHCDRPAAPFPTGVRRHVTDPTSYAAWRFAGHDTVILTDAQLDAFADGPDWPATPELIGAEGDPGVYIRDGSARRHVTSPAVMDAWRFDWAAIARIDLAELTGMEARTPISPRPFLVRGTGPAVYVIDAPPPIPDAGVIDAGVREDDGGATTRADGGARRDGGGRDAGAGGVTPGRPLTGCTVTSGARTDGARLAALLFACAFVLHRKRRR